MKEDILDLAIEQLESGGYDNLNFARIADALSITRANIHHHFKDKEGLAIESTKRTLEMHLTMSKQMAQENKGDVYGFLKVLEKNSIQTINEQGDKKNCLCSQLVLGSGIPITLSTLSKEYIKNIRSMLENLITESQQAGNINKKHEPSEMATHLVSIMLGMNQLAIVNSGCADSSVWMKGLYTNWVKSYQ